MNPWKRAVRKLLITEAKLAMQRRAERKRERRGIMAQIKSEKPKNAKTTQRSVRPKQLTDANVASQLELASRLDAMLAQASGKQESLPAKAPETFLLSIEDGQRITACVSDERPVAEWLLTGVYGVLSVHGPEINQSKLHLMRAVQGVLLNAQPKTVTESVLLSQLLACHEMLMIFARRSMETRDSDLAVKFAGQVSRLADVCARQSEAIQKLRGEEIKQSMRIEHVHMSEGAQAVFGSVGAAKGEGVIKK